MIWKRFVGLDPFRPIHPPTLRPSQDNFEEIDPSVIVGRRTRGIRVDYTSKEALERAGVPENAKDDDEEEDVEMKD